MLVIFVLQNNPLSYWKVVGLNGTKTVSDIFVELKVRFCSYAAAGRTRWLTLC